MGHVDAEDEEGAATSRSGDDPARSRPGDAGDEPAPDAHDEDAPRAGSEEDAASEAEAAAPPEDVHGARSPAPDHVEAPERGDAALAGAARHLSIFDFASRPSSRAAWVARIAATVLALSFAGQRLRAATNPMLSAKPPAAIPTEEADGTRFRIPERTRREIFAELAAAELAERARAVQANTWNGHLWSREDDRGHYERVAARAVAAKYKVSLSQVYLVLDEGLRDRWPAPDGKPLPATTPPLDMRPNAW